MVLGNEVVRDRAQFAYYQFNDYYLKPIKLDGFNEKANEHNRLLTAGYNRFYDFEHALKYISFGFLGLLGLLYLLSNTPEGELSKEDEEKILFQKQEDVRNNQFR